MMTGEEGVARTSFVLTRGQGEARGLQVQAGPAEASTLALVAGSDPAGGDDGAGWASSSATPFSRRMASCRRLSPPSWSPLPRASPDATSQRGPEGRSRQPVG
jgi:hypothetical protein